MKQIIEGNKLIAEFMGAEYNAGLDSFRYELNQRPDTQFLEHWHSTHVKYHLSWDWLMPVVEKIEEKGFTVKIDTNYITIAKYNNIIQLFNTEKSKITMVWTAVVQFIQWLHSEQNPDRSVATEDAQN